MRRPIAFRSGVAGIAVGGLFAGGTWWLYDSPVLTTAVGVVWAVATGLFLYVSQSNPVSRGESPWGAVVGGSLLFSVVLNLSDITLSNGAIAALSVLTIGFTLLGYAAGMAAVDRQQARGRLSDEAVAD